MARTMPAGMASSARAGATTKRPKLHSASQAEPVIEVGHLALRPIDKQRTQVSNGAKQHQKDR